MTQEPWLVPPLVDSHCHLNQLDLTAFDGQLDKAIIEARSQGVQHFLSVCVTLDDVNDLKELSLRYEDISISIGIHPNDTMNYSITEAQLCHLSDIPKCIAIGETGLDYYRTESDQHRILQQESFRQHIRVARKLKKPLIIHTRHAIEDTIRIMKEENANEIGGVMHCFAEDWDIARAVFDLHFYISFSGILTFKSALTLQEVAKKSPLDRILIETDSPYLAPVPHRGKPNHPAWVRYVAEALSHLRSEPLELIAEATTNNFYDCFQVKTK